MNLISGRSMSTDHQSEIQLPYQQKQVIIANRSKNKDSESLRDFKRKQVPTLFSELKDKQKQLFDESKNVYCDYYKNNQDQSQLKHLQESSSQMKILNKLVKDKINRQAVMDLVDNKMQDKLKKRNDDSEDDQSPSTRRNLVTKVGENLNFKLENIKKQINQV